MSSNRLCILASGRGSNAAKIIDYFKDSFDTSIALVVSNKADAKVLELAQTHQIRQYVIGSRKSFSHSDSLVNFLIENNITHIILAGFLWLIPQNLISAFPNKIINIHPALLPKFGGKGMYGIHVHRAVKEANETKSGITIHLVNEHFDEGAHLAQFECDLHETDTPKQIADKVLELEHYHYPRVIEKFLKAD